MTLNCVNLPHHLLWISVPSQQPVCLGSRTGNGSSLSLQLPSAGSAHSRHSAHALLLVLQCLLKQKGTAERERGTAMCMPPSPVWIQVTCCLVTKLCLTLCDLTDCSKPGFPVLHHLPEFAQIHVHWVGDAIQTSHPQLPTSPALNLFLHWGLFQWVSSLHQVARSIRTSASASFHFLILPLFRKYFPVVNTWRMYRH